MRSNDLREIIRNRLLTIPSTFGIKEVSFKNAVNDQMYPHIVYDFSSVDIDDYAHRKDYMIDIEVISKNDMFDVQDIADTIENLFFYWNCPGTNENITFYCESRIPVEDPDKTINRLIVRLSAQLYERS